MKRSSREFSTEAGKGEELDGFKFSSLEQSHCQAVPLSAFDSFGVLSCRCVVTRDSLNTVCEEVEGLCRWGRNMVPVPEGTRMYSV